MLRCFELTDAEALLRASQESQAHLRDWMPWAVDLPRDVDQQLPILRRFRGEYDRDLQYTMAVLSRASGALLGACGLHPRCGVGGLEIGYWVHVEHLRRGYATEMAAALTRAGFELFGVDRMEIHCDPRNLPSRGVPERLGYTLEGTLRRRIPWLAGPAHDKEVWTLFAEEHVQQPSAGSSLVALDALGRRLI